MKKSTYEQAIEDAAECIRTRGWDLQPTLRFWTVLRYVSKSNMMRHIGLYIEDPEGRMHRLLDDVRVEGCGMDMGFHLADSVFRRLGANTLGKSFQHSWL